MVTEKNNRIRSGIVVIFMNAVFLRTWWVKYRPKFKWEERYAYVMLAALSFGLAAMAVLVSLYEIRVNNHNFCDVLNITSPISKPADPKADPSRERSYEAYVKVVKLSHKLGCS